MGGKIKSIRKKRICGSGRGDMWKSWRVTSCCISEICQKERLVGESQLTESCRGGLTKWQSQGRAREQGTILGKSPGQMQALKRFLLLRRLSAHRDLDLAAEWVLGRGEAASFSGAATFPSYHCQFLPWGRGDDLATSCFSLKMALRKSRGGPWHIAKRGTYAPTQLFPRCFRGSEQWLLMDSLWEAAHS